MREPTHKAISVAAVGDIMLGEHPIHIGDGVRYRIAGRDSKYLFQNVRSCLQNNDLVFGKLKAVLSNRGLNRWSLWSSQLHGEPKSSEGIKYAGFNVLNLSNNHALDHGREALDETIALCTIFLNNRGDSPVQGHANGLNALLARIETDLCVFADPDVMVLMKDWDRVCRAVLSDKVVAVGAPYLHTNRASGRLPGCVFCALQSPVIQRPQARSDKKDMAQRAGLYQSAANCWVEQTLVYC
jgi:hypothetical protein